MRPARVLRSAAFGLALFYAGLFGGSAALFSAGFGRAVDDYAEASTERDLAGEVARVRTRAERLALPALAAFVARRERTSAGGHYRYLLVGPHGERLAGTLPASIARAGAFKFELPDTAEADDVRDDGADARPDTIRAVGLPRADGAILVFARDEFAMTELTRWVDRATLWTGAAFVVLPLIGGYLIAWAFVARVERVNAAARRIMAGRLDERLPTISVGDEFRRLSASLNAMLDRIEALMDGLRQVSTDIAHDLRTPLTRLRHTLERVGPHTSVADARDATGIALEQLDAVLAIFAALLRIGLIEGGADKAGFARLDLGEVMGRVADAYRPAAEDAGKQLLDDLAPAIWLDGDAELLTQMFANLIENAIVHGGDRVRMELRRQGMTIIASVADDGPGIPAAERAKVLRRFYRLDASRSSPGAGLGLALVSAIADLHELALVVSDNMPGLRVALIKTCLAGYRRHERTLGTDNDRSRDGVQ